ncbi:Soluble ligand binding domain protein [Segniliparus rotundus DSM 44985]|uniref:Soluble ligand binding domain protein n=1 Tax=Segniliparus rotundus (strain ATCC BAA-972 / CDC 1076 / CIP 108378 / DSM 44985 / JCM 13578) TaxID=640132 RepID=D6ZEW0_SEGRD|nr:ComEA family DNA-binding protein [Segniliparus rotundus]ADG97484.1 Soluble ligand binding domain protein [Segniliparus rotundus DSM 44985]
MSKHDAFDETDFYDDGFEEPRRSRWKHGEQWWSGRVAAAAALCAVGVLALAFTLFDATREGPKAAAYPALPSVVPPPTQATEPTTAAAQAREIVVSVVGAVRQPGLARLAPGARVADAVEAAGGLNPDAEAAELNFAQRLQDGDQVVVGAAVTSVTPVPPAPKASSAPRPGPVPAATRAPASSRCDCAGGSAGGAAPSRSKQTDVNTATEAELDIVPGVGKSIARAIVQYRAAHGRIRNLDELAKVKQVGARRLQKLRPYLRV